MTTNKAKTPPPPLREQIVRILTERGTQTRAQIVPLTSEANYESRVTTELNRMRADGVIECAKKTGKNELEYWLAVPGALVSETKGVEAASMMARVRLSPTQSDESETSRLRAVLADVLKAAGAPDSTPLEEVASAVREMGQQYCASLDQLNQYLDVMRNQLRHAHLSLKDVCDQLRDVIDSPIDPTDMNAVEMAQAAAKTISTLRDGSAPQAAPQRAAPVGYVALRPGDYPEDWSFSDDYEACRQKAEEIGVAEGGAIVVAVVSPMLRGEAKRTVFWSAQ